MLVIASIIGSAALFADAFDFAVGLVVGVINLSAAAEVFEQARAENPELKLGVDD